MTDTPEFSRILDIRHIEAKPLELEANADERKALASRFGLVAVDRLNATLTLAREGEMVTATGRLRAAFTQSCAVSAEDLPQVVDAAIALRFVPEAQTVEEGEEVELTDADCDEIPYTGERIDLGEAVAESLALEIDPFATGPEADAVRRSGLLGEENASPFAALAALKKD